MKKAILTTLQIAVTIGILWLVFRDPAKRHEMATAIRNADALWLLAGIASYGIVEVLAGLRWQMLLRVQGIGLSTARIFTLMMIGVFFNFFVPGGTGGDVVKVFYLLKETPGRRAHALLSVLVDRIVGLFALAALAGIFIALRWDWLTTTAETTRYVWIALAILGGSVVSIGSSFLATGLGLIHKMPAHVPGREKIAELTLAYNLYGKAWRVSLGALLIGIVAHIGYFFTFYCAGRALAGPGVVVPSFGDLCAILPIVNTIASMPISFGGLGVREGLFQVFLGTLTESTDAIAVVVSSTGYLLTLFWGLLGGVLYMLYRPSEHAKLREMTAEISQLEHTVAEEEIAAEQASDSTKRR